MFLEVIYMPYKPMRPCRYDGCTKLCKTGVYCEEHSKLMATRWGNRGEEFDKKRERLYDKQRGTRTQRGYDGRWQKARKTFLEHHPLCAECQRRGVLTPATVVDHIIPHRGDKTLFWDTTNWQPLCKSCHDRKTARGE